MNLLVITPTQRETGALHAVLARRGFEAAELALEHLPATRYPALDLTTAFGGIGKAQFAIHTQYLLDNLPAPDLVICAGTAGALEPQLSVADVVAATLTIEHDFYNRFNDNPRPEFPGAPDALAWLAEFDARGAGFRLHFGPVASGDEDVIDALRAADIRAHSGALAVAWEGAGGARACAFIGVPFLELRAISDSADGDAPEAYRSNILQAIDNIAAVVIHLCGVQP